MSRTALITRPSDPFTHSGRIVESVSRFFLSPASPRPLGALRIGLGLVLMAQAIFVRTEITTLLGSNGLVQGDLAQYLSAPFTPRISWLAEQLSPLGISETVCISAVCWVYFLSLLFLTLGLYARAASLLTWFLHWMLMCSGNTSTYGADQFAHVYLFYLIWVPAGHAFSLDVLLGRRSGSPTAAARLGLRLLQLHLCIVYLSSGIEKSMGSQWWDGELLWRVLSTPIYRQFDMTWIYRWPLLSKLAGLTAMFIEIGYSIFIWPNQTRWLWITLVVALHLGIVVFLGLGIFGAIMCVLTLSLFGVAGAPRGPLLGAALGGRLIKRS